MGKGKGGWVNVSVETYQSHRNSSSQRVVHQEYMVDESGATLNAITTDADHIMQDAQEASTTSIFIRDWKLTGRRGYIQYNQNDSGFWFCPVVDQHTSHSNQPGFPCNRGDIFLKLGMRGARLIPWRLLEGDVFRLGQAYILVSKVRATSDTCDISALSTWNDSSTMIPSEAESHSDDDICFPSSEAAPQCYICYETGGVGDPLINPCQCSGSVKYVHLSCLSRWIQPEGSSTVNTHCPVCKARYPEKTQALMIRPPAVLLESWSNHRSLKLRHWVSFAQHGTASLGRFTEHNDVVIPDHSVSGEHALLVYNNGEFWLHDRESSNGSFIRLCTPLRLGFGESLHLKMGKSLLHLQAKRSRWSRIRMRLNLLRSLDDWVEDSRSRSPHHSAPTDSSGT